MFAMISTFIIFIAGRLRQGQFPRLADFPYSEKHGKYIYQGRELNAEEFNAAAEAVFSPNYRNNGYSFQPQVLEAEESAAPAEPEPPPAEPPAVDPPAFTPEGQDPFTIEGQDIFHEGARVASFQEDGSVRMARGFSSLRDKLDAWLTPNPESP